MGAKAEVEVGFGGLRGGIKDLGDLRDALIGVEGAGKRLNATYKGLKGLLEDPAGAKGGWSNASRVTAGITKMAAEAAAAQASAAASAVTAPGKTTYAQALTGYRNYREQIQRMATAGGESFGAVDKHVMDTSKRLGILPGQVQAYGASIRNVAGGTMTEALDGMDAAREQSLKTGQSIQELIGPVLKLRQNFGIKSSQEINDFFGAVDSGASKAKISAEVARTAWEASSGMLQRISSMSPRAQAAFTNQIVGNSVASGQSPEMGTEHAMGLAGFFENKSYLLNRLAHKKGLLKKGEHLLGADGRITAKGFGIAAELSQSAMSKFYGKDPVMAGMKAQLSGEMSASDYAQLVAFDAKKYGKDANKFEMFPQRKATDNWVISDAGKREAGEAQKDRRDLGLGGGMIGAQDAAVMAGGGAFGIAMAAAGGIFTQATGIFSSAVDRWIGALGKGGGAGGTGVGTAAGAATGSAAPSVVKGVVTRGALATAGVVGIAAGAVFLPGDAVPGSQGEEANQTAKQKELAAAKQRLARMQVPAHGIAGWASRPWGSVEDQKKHVAELQAQVSGQGIDYAKMAQENAKAQASQILKVQLVDPPKSPPGPWAPP